MKISKVQLSIDYIKAVENLVRKELNDLNLLYRVENFNTIIFDEPIHQDDLQVLKEKLSYYNIHCATDERTTLVHQIKEAVNEMIYSEENDEYQSGSEFLTTKFAYSYKYLSAVFSEETLTTLENYIILKKIDRAKQLIMEDNLSLTQIANKLRYSSVSHLSRQFKNIIGLTPSQFEKIIQKRNQKRT